MVRNARLEAVKNTLIIQGYVLSDDGMVALTEDGHLALICLLALLPPKTRQDSCPNKH